MTHKRIYPCCALVLLLTACGSKRNSKTPPPETAIPVVTEQVQRSASGTALSLSGNIEGNKTVRLAFMVAGKINYMAAEEGQPVSAKQLVSSLDPVNYSIAKQMADVQVNQVGDEYKRLKLMFDRNSVSESDFKKVEFALEQARNQQQQQAQNLAYTKLYSPISGVLLKKLMETGEITSVGNPVLVISDISKVKVMAYLPENELHSIRIGQSAQVRIPALDSVYSGKVTEVGSAADATSRAFTIKIELANPRLLIRPGMIAEITIPTNKRRNTITIPGDALLRDTDGQSYVYIADTTEHKAFKRKVIPGPLVDNRIAITSGLNEGEVIVTGGQQKLADGATISLTK